MVKETGNIYRYIRNVDVDAKNSFVELKTGTKSSLPESTRRPCYQESGRLVVQLPLFPTNLILLFDGAKMGSNLKLQPHPLYCNALSYIVD